MRISAVLARLSPRLHRPSVVALMLGGALLTLLAMLRPHDHDESQYVAATVLAGSHRLYRDFAYFQTPLQPLAMAPLAAIAGSLTWPALRLANVALALAGLVWSYRAMLAARVLPRIALVVTCLMGACDSLLFSAGVARNDALPFALLALALAFAVRAEAGDASRRTAATIGLALGLAAAAKISFALPAAAHFCFALADRRARRPLWIAVGALPAAAIVALAFAQAPEAFWVDVLRFPAEAPAEYYRASGAAWKLGAAMRLVDLAKFLALGPAVVALVGAIVGQPKGRIARLATLWTAAGLIAAALPNPLWRQYLMPALPPLFLLLALAWQQHAPGRITRVLLVAGVVSGLAPTLSEALRTEASLTAEMRDGAALRRALDGAGVSGPVAGITPELVVTAGREPDPRFAPGPFYFRSHGLLPAEAEARLALLNEDDLRARFAAAPPAALLVGSPDGSRSKDAALAAPLLAWAQAAHWRELPVGAAGLQLFVPPQATRAAASPPPRRASTSP